jgi:DNA-binding response OmpR family regulator
MTTKVYYLDDEFFLCEIFKEYFSADNIEVKVFTDAREAIAECARVPPDMMFIDYRLADTTGLEVAKKLSDKILKVLVTGELQTPQNDQFIRVIEKPFELRVLSEVITEHFGEI